MSEVIKVSVRQGDRATVMEAKSSVVVLTSDVDWPDDQLMVNLGDALNQGAPNINFLGKSVHLIMFLAAIAAAVRQKMGEDALNDALSASHYIGMGGGNYLMGHEGDWRGKLQEDDFDWGPWMPLSSGGLVQGPSVVQFKHETSGAVTPPQVMPEGNTQVHDVQAVRFGTVKEG